MKKILIASAHNDDLVTAKGVLDEFFEVHCISSPDLVPSHMEEFDLLLLDHSFEPDSGIDFMTNILSLTYLPVLMLTSPDDPKSAVDALRSGAYNYIVKMPGYEQLLLIAATEAINKFSERESMKQTILDLKKQISDLESHLDIPDNAEDEIPLEISDHTNEEQKPNIFTEIVKRLKQGEINLPPAPGIISLFRGLVEKGADYGQFAELLKKDIAIASKLIMVSNSPIYRGLSENKNVDQAIARLGIGVTEQYVYIISNRALYASGQKKYMSSIERLWEHSLATAYASQAISTILNLKLPNDAFSLGLFHDIGKLILLQVIGELEIKGKFSQVVEEDEVIKIVEAYHGQFGASLLKRWNYSEGYIQAATFHDNLQEADPLSRDLLVIHFANNLAHNLGYSMVTKEVIHLDTTESARLLKITPDVIARIIVQVQIHMKNAALIFAT